MLILKLFESSIFTLTGTQNIFAGTCSFAAQKYEINRTPSFSVVRIVRDPAFLRTVRISLSEKA